MSHEQLLTIPEISERLGVSNSAVYAYAKSHNLRFRSRDKLRALPETDVAAWELARKTGTYRRRVPAQEIITPTQSEPVQESNFDFARRAFEQSRDKVETRLKQLTIQINSLTEERDLLQLEVDDCTEQIEAINKLEQRLNAL